MLSATNQSEKANSKGFRSYRNLRTKQMNMGGEQKGTPENRLLTAENKVRLLEGRWARGRVQHMTGEGGHLHDEPQGMYGRVDSLNSAPEADSTLCVH